MKKKTSRQSHTRLETLDSAQLAQVSGGASAQFVRAVSNLIDLSTDYPPGSGWSEFFSGAAYGALG